MNDECPHCGADLQGLPIPVARQHLFGATHFSRKIGIVVKDRVVQWRCPDCGGAWDRNQEASE